MPDHLSVTLFKTIESTYYKEKKNLVDDISELLHIQKSSVYKKIKGESAIGLEEAGILCAHYKISLDEILGLNENLINFDFPAIKGNVKNVNQFLQSLETDLQSLYRLDPTIYYATKELPMFYYCTSPKLAAFKFHVFYNTVWRDDKYQMISFDYSQYDNDDLFKRQIKNIVNLFMSVNSIEVWNVGILDNTLNQIRYFLESGLMKDPLASLDLCQELLLLVDNIEELCENSNKSSMKKSDKLVGSFELYNNEIAHTNILAYVESKVMRCVYNTYDNPNFMKSYNPSLCDYTFKWFNRIIDTSAPLSKGNLKDRKNFINRLQEKIKRTIKFLEPIIDEKSFNL
ncbi:MAG: hypothetical protein JNK69_03470 [Saprospiraceae bacterium]|nr:hypothetical protein [Candidatus Vicinibacter proximus]MBL7822444.1 hypothetical protein [Saprospiraceae bacterium]MCC6843196.1 hypothetical protein [Saprospiraceae bacterium]HRG32094.1 hypothetical protein [Saprospiraceae bacterium]